jgi:hypothetical protein
MTSVGQLQIWIDFERDKVLFDEPHSAMINMQVWGFATKQKIKKIRALSIGLF